MNEIERQHSIRMLRKYMEFNWTEDQQSKLSEAFSVIEQLFIETSRDEGKRKELNAIAGVRFTLERLVAAYMIKRMVEEQNNVPGGK